MIISIVFSYHYVLNGYHCVLFHLVTDIIMPTELVCHTLMILVVLHCVCKFSASDVDCKLFDIMNELLTLLALCPKFGVCFQFKTVVLCFPFFPVGRFMLEIAIALKPSLKSMKDKISQRLLR